MTRSGWELLAGGLMVSAAGWWAGYPEVSAFGVGALLVLAMALAIAARPPSLGVERRITPERVTVGDPAEGLVTVTNRSRRTSASLICRDLVGPDAAEVAVPRLASGRAVTVPYPLPTTRRGVVDVGPLTAVHGDPFGLVERATTYGELDRLFIHPRSHALPLRSSGRRHDLTAELSGTLGSSVFHALREYVPGDDLRRVHWKATAHTGELMVREFVDPVQPDSVVVLDTRIGVLGAEPFELAVEAAASVAIANIDAGFPVRLVTPSGQDAGDPEARRRTRLSILDHLAGVEQRSGGGLDEVLRDVIAGAGGRSLTVVTGPVPEGDLARLAGATRRFAEVVVVAVGPHAPTAVPRGVDLVRAADAAQLVSAWVGRS